MLAPLVAILAAYGSCVFVMLVVLVGFQRTADVRSDYRCDGCRIAQFFSMLNSTSLDIDHVAVLVVTEKLDHV